LADEHGRVAHLEAALARLEVGVRSDRARLHEIHSTVAGIASASRLIRNSPQITDSRRDVLTGMISAEVERLHRLMGAASSTDRRRRVDLDDVIGRIVVSHRARGRNVRWTPSGRFALGRADDIAEIVDALLQNAARHGRPDRIDVEVREPGGEVEVVVTDDGTGIEPLLRPQVFDWGVRSALSVARDLARDLGGDLRLDDVSRGARFVLSLPVDRPLDEGDAGDALEGVSHAGALHAAT
jgi:signal transduction histidine kinase